MNNTIKLSYSRLVANATLLFVLFAVMIAPNTFGQTPTRSTVGKSAPEQPVATVVTPKDSVSAPSGTPPSISSAAPAPPPRASDARESLRNAKQIFVRSHSLLVGQSVIEGKLRNRKEFQQLGLEITRDPLAADLILEVKHDILTKYVFTAIDPVTNVVVASGKLSSLGGTVAGKVAKRFMKQVMKARTP